MNYFNSIKKINIFILLISFCIGFVVYIYPLKNISLGYDTWWIFFIQSSSRDIVFPSFYNYIGIEPENIVASGISLFDYFGRFSFIDWARFWLLAQVFENHPVIWRSVAVLSMSISLFYWVKIYRILSISKLSLSIVYIILLTDPQSLWLDWNKSESVAFLFFSISSYYYLSVKNKAKYFSVAMLIISILVKETFIIAIPFLIFIRAYKKKEFPNQSYYSKLFYYFNENKLLLIFGFFYSIIITIFTLLIDHEKSYVLQGNTNDVANNINLDFFFAIFKLIIPIQFHNLLNSISVLAILSTMIFFVFFTNFIKRIFKHNFTLSNGSIKNITNKKLDIYILPLLSFLAITIILLLFGNIARRYASPINIIIITSAILIYPVVKLYIFKLVKNELLIRYIDYFVYLILIFPFFILVSKFSLYVSVILLLFLLVYFLICKSKKYIYFAIIVLFLIPSIDRTIVNITVTKSIYESWDDINTNTIFSLPENSVIEISLSEQLTIEQAVSLEVNSVFNNRGDIVYFIDENKAKNLLFIDEHDFWHIQKFNMNKDFSEDNNFYIFRLLENKNTTTINNILERYDKYKNRYSYSIRKLN
tara:strand:- start:2603 stop:4375 length:1773 start_codon:yes stop_codon:yes gene_type:complete